MYSLTPLEEPVVRIGVVQHRMRPTAAEDVRTLVVAVREAVVKGADMVVIPCVVSVAGDSVRDAVLAEVRESGITCGLFAPACFSPGQWGVVDSLCCLEAVGPVAALCGDVCFDTEVWSGVAARGPSFAVLSPLSEGDLQAEAALEVALGLSDWLCGLVIVCECSGAEMGAPGHGGSAVMLLGDVVAEALGDEDLLLVDVEVPVAQPEPRGPLPEVPPILAQRLAIHAGRRPEVSYLADLSDGPVGR